MADQQGASVRIDLLAGQNTLGPAMAAQQQQARALEQQLNRTQQAARPSIGQQMAAQAQQRGFLRTPTALDWFTRTANQKAQELIASGQDLGKGLGAWYEQTLKQIEQARNKLGKSSPANRVTSPPPSPFEDMRRAQVERMAQARRQSQYLATPEGVRLAELGMRQSLRAGQERQAMALRAQQAVLDSPGGRARFEANERASYLQGLAMQARRTAVHTRAMRSPEGMQAYDEHARRAGEFGLEQQRARFAFNRTQAGRELLQQQMRLNLAEQQETGQLQAQARLDFLRTGEGQRGFMTQQRVTQQLQMQERLLANQARYGRVGGRLMTGLDAVAPTIARGSAVAGGLTAAALAGSPAGEHLSNVTRLAFGELAIAMTPAVVSFADKIQDMTERFRGLDEGTQTAIGNTAVWGGIGLAGAYGGIKLTRGAMGLWSAGSAAARFLGFGGGVTAAGGAAAPAAGAGAAGGAAGVGAVARGGGMLARGGGFLGRASPWLLAGQQAVDTTTGGYSMYSRLWNDRFGFSAEAQAAGRNPLWQAMSNAGDAGIMGRYVWGPILNNVHRPLLNRALGMNMPPLGADGGGTAATPALPDISRFPGARANLPMRGPPLPGFGPDHWSTQLDPEHTRGTPEFRDLMNRSIAGHNRLAQERWARQFVGPIQPHPDMPRPGQFIGPLRPGEAVPGRAGGETARAPLVSYQSQMWESASSMRDAIMVQQYSQPPEMMQMLNEQMQKLIEAINKSRETTERTAGSTVGGGMGAAARGVE